MNKSFLSGIALFLGLISCNQPSQDDPLNGTYVKAINTPYSKGQDTIIINSNSYVPNGYKVIRKAGYQRIKEGKLQSKKEFSQKETTALYSNTDHSLHEAKTGRIYSLNQDHKTLVIGTTEYEKTDR